MKIKELIIDYFEDYITLVFDDGPHVKALEIDACGADIRVEKLIVKNATKEQRLKWLELCSGSSFKGKDFVSGGQQ